MLRAPDTPGLYLQRDDSTRAGVTVVRTDITGFVGITEMGPVLRPTRIETMRQFEALFGTYIGGGFLAYCVRGFFEGGGRTCLVTRIASINPAMGAQAATRAVLDSGGALSFTIRAASPGTWGNGLAVMVSAAWRAETVAKSPPVSAAWLDVVSTDGFEAGHLVRASQPGAPEQWRVLAMVDASAARLYFVHPDPVSRRPTDAPLIGLLPEAPLRIERLDYDLAVRRRGALVAVYPGLSLVRGTPRYIVDVLRPVEPDADGRFESPPPVVVVEMPELLVGAVPVPLATSDSTFLPLSGGRDGLTELAASDFVAGLAALEDQRDVAILAVPDIHIQPVRLRVLPYAPPPLDPCPPCPVPVPAAKPLPPPESELPPVFSLAAIEQVQAAMLAQCERLRDRVALIDPPYATARDDRLGLGPVQAWRNRFDSAFGALFFPWLTVPDPLGIAPTRAIPPSGHVAGQHAATDLAVGCHKAAANVTLPWAQGATVSVAPAGHGLLNSAGINVITTRDGRPLRILGARTMTSDPDWRFLPVRRLISMLRRALDAATQWSVFEPNDAATRNLLAQSIAAFLESLRRGGALAGDRPAAAFLVRCDETNNPASFRANGMLVVDIAIAPSKPFEFILLRLGRRDDAFELAEQGHSNASLVGAA